MTANLPDNTRNNYSEMLVKCFTTRTSTIAISKLDDSIIVYNRSNSHLNRLEPIQNSHARAAVNMNGVLAC